MSVHDNGYDYTSKLKDKWEMQEFIQSHKIKELTGLDVIGIIEPEPSVIKPIEGEDISKLAGRILDVFISKRKDLIEKNISQINSEIRVRHILNNDSEKDIGAELMDTEIFMTRLECFVMGQNHGADLARVESMRRMINLKREQRQNTVKCWENLIILRKDLRKHIAEREAIVRTQEILSF